MIARELHEALALLEMGDAVGAAERVASVAALCESAGAPLSPDELDQARAALEACRGASAKLASALAEALSDAGRSRRALGAYSA